MATAAAPEINVTPTVEFRGETTNVTGADGDVDDGEQINQYMVHGKLGEGAFGSVFRVTDSETGQLFAMKVVSKARLQRQAGGARLMGRRPPGAPPVAQKDPLDIIRREIAIMKKLQHRHVLKLIEVLNNDETDAFYMVLELAPNGVVMSLDGKEAAEPLSDAYARKVFRQLLLGVEYLHYQDIAHRDIKPDNLLVNAAGDVLLCDFSVSEEYNNGEDGIRKTAGSPAFMAPEMLVARDDNETFSAKRTDIWAMGVTLFCLLTGRVPFKADTVYMTYEAIKNDPIEVPNHVGEGAHQLILGMMQRSSEDRLSINDMKAHPWVTEEGAVAMPSTEENCNGSRIEVTDDDIARSIGSIRNMSNLMTVMRAVNRFRSRRSSEASAHSRRSSDMGVPAEGVRRESGDSLAV